MLKAKNEFLELEQKFRDYYRKNLLHKYVELEPQRRIYLDDFNRRLCLCIIGGVILLILVGLFWINVDFDLEILKILFFYLLFAFWVCSKPFSKFKKATKSLVMEQVLSFWRDYKYYNHKILISEKYIKKSALFEGFNAQKQGDAFKGKYHDVEIEVSEQKLLTVKDPLVSEENFNPDNEKEKIFEGVLIALHLNKMYEGNTVVLEKKFSVDNPFSSKEHRLLSIFAMILLFVVSVFWGIHGEHAELVIRLWFGFCSFLIFYIIYLLYFFFKEMFAKEKDYQVFLEDVVFDKKWKVFADDQIEARYILTPAMMERMLDVKKLFHGKRLDFSFWENNLLIAIHTTDDMFETTSLFNSALDYRKVQEVICQMYSIFSVIDLLKIQGESESKA